MVAYLLASLPAPRLGQVPAVESATFLERSRSFVGEERARDLAWALGLDDPTAVKVPPTATAPTADALPAVAAPPAELADDATRRWADLAAQIDDAVVQRRSARDRRDPAPYLRNPAGFRVDVAEAVAAAFALPDPGARERALDELRWRLADELGRSVPDGFGALLGRAVQLRLAWRWAGWDTEAGTTELEALLRRIEERRG
jgi:hypothetical protein